MRERLQKFRQKGFNSCKQCVVYKSAKGITLIALIATILILLILVGVVLNLISGQEGLINKAVQSKFIHNIRTVEESVQMYISEQKMEQLIDKHTSKVSAVNTIKLPITTELSKTEKNKIPTLVETVETLNNGKSINNTKLYWIDLDLLNLNMSNRYIIDIETLQIYDYEGEYFSGKRWHTLQMGVTESGTDDGTEDSWDEMWDGWITLELYYPDDAKEKMWRLSEEGETRYDESLAWEEYTGPITVRISQIPNIWIKYKINGETVIMPPLGKMLVDIEVSPTGGKRDSVNVKINFDKEAETKEYRVNGGPWQNYEGEFTITENVLIEAKGTKTENIYDADGNLLSTRKITGKDAYFIRNIGKEEIDETLPAPTITRLSAQSPSEVARVKITYPENASEKIYKVNYGAKQNYTQEISIEKYGTEIIAYYKTAEGKTSSHAYLYINGTSGGGAPSQPSIYKPQNPSEIPETTDVLAGPNIKIAYSSNEQATITLSTAEVARNIYIQLGNKEYQEYTGPITVCENMTVRAYYVSEVTGETSRTSYSRVSGLHQGNRPSVVIDADPYPYGNTNLAKNPVTVTVTTDADISEYSFDGVVYQTYTGSLTVSENCRIYAKATNDYGTTVEYLDITNLSNNPPVQKDKLSVNIMVNPEPSLTTSPVASANVTIEYDSRATKKYYSFGRYGARKEYTGPFEVTNNCTIYAYATSENGVGQAVKVVDNLTTGIAEPIIDGSPANSQTSGKTKITITFDKTATTKRYEIDGSGLRDYTGPFEVEQNCVIRAVNTNSLGQSSEATYSVTNIVGDPPKLLLDMGDYYLLKLPFPEIAAKPEYKFKENGSWKSYTLSGLVLIKPSKQAEFEGMEIIEIVDENGNKQQVKKEHCYILDVPVSQLFEHISMRWDRSEPTAPTILLDTEDPTREVTVSIQYASNLLKREFNIMYLDGKMTGWKKYENPFKITQKGTIIYARGMDEAEVYSKQGIKEITNIDEEPPVIKLSADLENAQQQVGVKVVVTDDIEVALVKWAQGNLGESYFANGGTAIENNSIVGITANGTYIFYAEDSVGNKQIKTLIIGNVDNTPPQIDIQVSPETVGLESKVTIDYGDSTLKQYKIGENTTTWTNYTGEITLTSYEVLALGLKNEDNTVTVFAKGKDSAGNEIIEQKKILNLDLDAPATPVINSNYGYPILTEYGVDFDGETTIVFDTRTDVENYYSLDNGATWNVYNGVFQVKSSGTIIAKSVKKGSGLEAIASKEIGMPADALGPLAYDGKEETYYENSSLDAYINVGSSMIGKKVRIKFKINAYSRPYVYFMDNNNKIISSTYADYATMFEQILTIPQGTTKIRLNRRC